MDTHRANTLKPGLYVIAWTDNQHSRSNAAIGIAADGTNWIAPADQPSGSQPIGELADQIDHVCRLEHHRGISGAIYLSEPIR